MKKYLSYFKKFDPEFAHNIAILSLKYGLQPKEKLLQNVF